MQARGRVRYLVLAIVVSSAGALILASPAISAQRANLSVKSLANPPANREVGSSFKVTDTVRNGGKRKAGSSQNDYFLSSKGHRTGKDVGLRGRRKVKALRPGKSSHGSAQLTIPIGTNAGRYYLIACADAKHEVKESNERDNCRGSAERIKVTARKGGGGGKPDAYAYAVKFTGGAVYEKHTNYGDILWSYHDAFSFTSSWSNIALPADGGKGPFPREPETIALQGTFQNAGSTTTPWDGSVGCNGSLAAISSVKQLALTATHPGYKLAIRPVEDIAVDSGGCELVGDFFDENSSATGSGKDLTDGLTGKASISPGQIEKKSFTLHPKPPQVPYPCSGQTSDECNQTLDYPKSGSTLAVKFKRTGTCSRVKGQPGDFVCFSPNRGS